MRSIKRKVSNIQKFTSGFKPRAYLHVQCPDGGWVNSGWLYMGRDRSLKIGDVVIIYYNEATIIEFFYEESA